MLMSPTTYSISLSFSLYYSLVTLLVLDWRWQVIFAHAIGLSNPPGVQNPQVIMPPDGVWNSFMWQIVPAGFMAVDSFFFLSGFLASYLLLKNLRASGGLSTGQWILVYVHRFLRIAPSVGVIILVQCTIAPSMVSGPFAYTSYDIFMKNCVESEGGGWWAPLLFINNFFPFTKLCAGWTWYLVRTTRRTKY
eukprot:GFYU01008301.1.p1 GENE.GFYU01008301.1~~GFYU01008301.1.p1  ORF type:complete len:192 (-),score=26.36 GFYU01008301.1:117-692(-)